MRSKTEQDLSSGSVPRQLILFAVPFLLSSILQSLYNFADMVIIGQFAGSASLSGVTTGSQFSNVITNLFVGLSTGCTVLVGQYHGCGDREAQRKTVGSAFTFMVLLAAVISAALLAFTDTFLSWMQTPAESYSEARAYYVCCAFGNIFIAGYNALAASLQGLGDSRRPLIFVIVSGLVNIVTSLVFVAAFQMGAFGAALGTVLAQFGCCVAAMVYMAKSGDIFSLRPSALKMHGAFLKKTIAVGIPAALQHSLSSLSFTFITAIINTLSYAATAAQGGVGKIVSIAIMPCTAMMSAVAAMSAQNFGAGKPERAVKTMKVGLTLSMSISFVLLALFQLFAPQLMRMFGDDADMIREGVAYIRTMSLDFVLVPFAAVIGGLFMGAGHSKEPSIINAGSGFVIRIPAAWIFGITLGWGMSGIGLATVASSVVAAVVTIILYFRGGWKVNKILPN